MCVYSYIAVLFNPGPQDLLSIYLSYRLLITWIMCAETDGKQAEFENTVKYHVRGLCGMILALTFFKRVNSRCVFMLD